MCGIIGYTGSQNSVPILIDGLKRLEYRGYDSAGIAVQNQSGFQVVKRQGRLSALESALLATPLTGFTGIGHTRWATHGEPSDKNSHPHLGSKSKIAIVHNGIIENYAQLRAKLERRGIVFTSQTDSEVVAQLAEYYYQGSLLDTVIKVIGMLEGSYALGIMCLNDPGTLVAVKKDNPLVIGTAKDGSYIASDIPAILKYTTSVYTMQDKEIAVLSKDGVAFYNTDKEPVHKETETISWSLDSAEKGGYQHFMLKEIMEQPKVLRDTIHSILHSGDNKACMERLNPKQYKKIVIAACGSAYNAGVVGKYVFERLCRVPVEVELASEFRYKDPIVDENSLVILISQSGETADTIAAMREAKAKHATTLSIVNGIGSTIAKETDHTLYTLAGPEIAVATTKAFSAQLAVLYLLAVQFARQLGRLAPEKEQELLAEILALPDKVAEMLQDTGGIQKYAFSCIGYKSIFFIGRNIDYSIALEGSLKLKEISYIHSEAYAGGELKHGPISLIEENTLVVAISNCVQLAPKTASNAEQVISRGGKVLWLGSTSVMENSSKFSHIALPQTHELFSPSLSVVAMQLFSYYVAANKGLDIDKPRNLAKSVTVE